MVRRADLFAFACLGVVAAMPMQAAGERQKVLLIGVGWGAVEEFRVSFTGGNPGRPEWGAAGPTVFGGAGLAATTSTHESSAGINLEASLVKGTRGARDGVGGRIGTLLHASLEPGRTLLRVGFRFDMLAVTDDDVDRFVPGLGPHFAAGIKLTPETHLVARFEAAYSLTDTEVPIGYLFGLGLERALPFAADATPAR